MKQNETMAENGQFTKNTGEIILYQPDSSIRLEVRMGENTVWLNLNQMKDLFGRDKSVISRHLRNIYNEGELQREATVGNFVTVQRQRVTNRHGGVNCPLFHRLRLHMCDVGARGEVVTLRVQRMITQNP